MSIPIAAGLNDDLRVNGDLFCSIPQHFDLSKNGFGIVLTSRIKVYGVRPDFNLTAWVEENGYPVGKFMDYKRWTEETDNDA